MSERAGRVIAGTARGTRLIAPPEGVRPLGDRVKQTLFAILEPELRGSAFLDLFAGTGAAGIEALSRGSARAVFVERDAESLGSIKRNLDAARLAGQQALVVSGDVARWLRESGSAAGAFDVVFADPPYDRPELLVDVLTTISEGGPGRLLAPGGVVVTKHFWKTGPPARVGLLASVRERRFGETELTFHRWEAG
jgi:16S rRNA (guanine(966)-N(2))-methyltransferase RsmD